MSPTRSPRPAGPGPLAPWLAGRRWYAGHDAPETLTEQRVVLPTTPALAVVVVETEAGHRYQLVRSGAARPRVHDLADDPRAAAALARLVIDEGASTEADGPRVIAHRVTGAVPPGSGTAHLLGGEQSNTSVVVGGTHVLKVLRRLHSGPSPEVEVGRHLAAVAASGTPAPVAPLAGWYELHDGDHTTTLGVLHELVPGALDAWALVLSALAGGPDGLLARLRHLGVALADLHGALAQPAVDLPAGTAPDAPEAFGSIALAPERIAALVTAIETDADAVLADLDGVTDRVGPAAVRAHAERLAAALPAELGAAIRHHGDLHLGQVVLGPDGWVILDFEGEPARPMAERRLRHSPLRDVAGMLRSFAYAAATHRRSQGTRLSPGWEPAARAAFLDGYLATVDPALLPPTATATATLLELFELEKVVYEIGYERSHRPDWVPVPLDGLHRILREAHP